MSIGPASHCDVATWLQQWSAALRKGDVDAVSDLFLPHGYWRDLVAFSWNIVTAEGREQIGTLLDFCMADASVSQWDTSAAAGAAEGFISFTTPTGRGEGYIRLEAGQCLTLLTALAELRGHEERRGARRPWGWANNADEPVNWRERLDRDKAAMGLEHQPYVAIVGGGQGGLALAARLKSLGVPALVLDRHPRVGDQWRSRYKSLLLHDPVWYDHMPYLPFPDTWPIYTPKDKMGDWLEYYAEIMELNVWTSASVGKARYDADRQHWTIEVDRGGETIELLPTHLVLATGNAGFPNRPEFPGSEDFAGIQRHSSEHPGGEASAGLKVVVVGSNNSAHDICADLVEHGADVTMLQRSSTLVIQSSTLRDVLLKPLYSEEAVAKGIDVEKADLLAASVPLRLQEQIQRRVWKDIAARDRAFYERLDAAGFMLDFGEDGTGMWAKYLRRAAGYYVNVGASEMIADGRIKLRSGLEVKRLASDGVVLSDGSKVAADMIIYATGFGSMEAWAASLISPEVAAAVGKCWGYGSGTMGDAGPWLGELRNMWVPTAQEGLWFHGGNLSQSRFYSHYLAIQLKARHAGLPVRVFDREMATEEALVS